MELYAQGVSDLDNHATSEQPFYTNLAILQADFADDSLMSQVTKFATEHPYFAKVAL